jgi:hypothetical protein
MFMQYRDVAKVETADVTESRSRGIRAVSSLLLTR